MERKHLGNSLLGIIFIAVGIIYLLSNLGFFPEIWKNIITSWKSLIILVGVVSICKRNYVSGSILMLVGLCLLLPELSAVWGFSDSEATVQAICWSVLIIMKC